MVTSETCNSCATLEGADLVMGYFEARFLQAHPEIVTLACFSSNGELDKDIVLESAQGLADTGDLPALDFIVAIGLRCKIDEDLFVNTDHPETLCS